MGPNILSLHTPKSNRLLAALPEEAYQALLPSLEEVPLPLGMAVYESGGEQRYVYFPTTSIVSLLYVHGGRRIRGNRRRRQRRHGRHLAVHGRRDHAEPRGGAKRRPRLPAEGRSAEEGVRIAAARCSTCCCAIRRR